MDDQLYLQAGKSTVKGIGKNPKLNYTFMTGYLC